MMKAGLYKARIANWGFNKAKTGTPQLVFQFDLMAEIDPTLPDAMTQFQEPYVQRSLFRALTKDAVEYVVEDLKKLGYDRETFDEFDPAHPNAFPFKGVEFDVKCEHDVWNNRPVERWAFSWAGGGPAMGALPQDDMRKVNMLFGAKLKGLRAGKPAGVMAPPSQAAAPPASAEKAAVSQSVI